MHMAVHGDWRELRELAMTGQLAGRSVTDTLGARLPTLASRSTAAAANVVIERNGRTLFRSDFSRADGWTPEGRRGFQPYP